MRAPPFAVYAGGWFFAGFLWGVFFARQGRPEGATMAEPAAVAPAEEDAMAYVFDPDRIWRATVTGVVDGDTLDMVFDTGFGNTHADRVRLYGVDTPETFGVKKDSAEHAAGTAAKDYIAKRLEPRMVASQPVWIETVKRGKFGRYLGIVWLNRDDIGDVAKSLNAELLREGHAALYKDEPLPLPEAGG